MAKKIKVALSVTYCVVCFVAIATGMSMMAYEWNIWSLPWALLGTLGFFGIIKMDKMIGVRE